MTARFRRIDLSQVTWHDVELPEGAAAFTIGRGPKVDLRIESSMLSRLHCRITSDGGRYSMEDLSASGIFLGGRKIGARHVLSTGDTFTFGDQVLVFVDRPEARDAEREAAIDENPDDAGRVLVWADWLSEHGDPLGEDLVRQRCGGAMLEGLQAQVDLGRLELVWRHGLVHTARLRTTDAARRTAAIDIHELLLRLLSLRACRWVRELVVDIAPEPMRLGMGFAVALRALLAAPGMPCLERASFGYTPHPAERSTFVDELVARLEARFPRVDVANLMPLGRRAWLEVETPPGFDFHHDGPNPQSIPLSSGVWVGSSTEGTLRAVSPGTTREGVATSFIVRANGWCFLDAAEPGLRLNGHPAMPVRLLPGDLIEDARGMRYHFKVA